VPLLLVVPVTNTEASDRWFTGRLEGVLPGAYKIAYLDTADRRRTALLGRLRVERGANGDASSVMQRCSNHGRWPWSLRGRVGRM
jgi:hypothetical protein